MDLRIKDKFYRLWRKYFNNAALPITFYYTNEEGHAKMVDPESVPRCVIGALANVRNGSSLCFDVDSIGCPGGKRYLGFTEGIMPGFEYFLSYGIPGRLRGERYCKSPELVKEIMKQAPAFKAPGRFIVFKRWDKLEKSDDPEVAIFFANLMFSPDFLLWPVLMRLIEMQYWHRLARAVPQLSSTRILKEILTLLEESSECLIPRHVLLFPVM